MITVANRIFVHADYAAALETAFRNRARQVDQMPGFVSNQVLRPTRPGDPYIVLTTWESQAHFEAWLNSEAFRQSHARLGGLPHTAFSQPHAVEVHEIILDTGRPDLAIEPLTSEER